MDLLTPAESHAFQSFLSAMDYADLTPSEWALLNSTNVVSDDEILGPGHSSELLAKATKDIMALDAGRWESLAQQPHSPYSHQSQQQQHQTFPNTYSHRQTPYSRRETFPFLNSKAQMQQSMLSVPPHHTDLHTHVISPTTSAPTSATTTPATPQSPFGFPDLPPSRLHLAQVQLNPSHLQQERPPSPGTKRTSFNAASGSSKRLRPSTPAASSTNSTASGSAKQTLLSPSQKKANHIQSEQKRRANIRRGYEALCETVPTLREAIREEEEAEARMSMGLGSSGKPSRSKRKKKDATGADGDKEKIDGRAGPRSENVVLSKTIDYVNELISDRTSLLARLERAKSALPPDHPLLVSPNSGERLWEREWKGGSGRIDGEAGEEDDENNDDGDSP